MKLGPILLLCTGGKALKEKSEFEQSGAIAEDIFITEERITLVESLDTENSEPNFESSSADIQFITRTETNSDEDTDSAEVVFTEDNNRQSKEDEDSRRTKLKKEEENAKEGAPESQTETQNRISVRTRIIEETRVQGEKEIYLSEKYELDSRTYEEEEEREEKMIVAIAAGIGGFFILMILLVTACCISRRRRNSEAVTTLPKRRTVEANPVEQTFERLDFSNASIGTTKRMKKAKEIHEVTSSEIAPSSMGTLRTFVDRSTHAKTGGCSSNGVGGGNESDFRNTSSDIDSIESSNPPKSTSKIITVISEKQKYELLSTRDRSNYSSSSTTSSCDQSGSANKVQTNHRIVNIEEAKPPPAYETITRSRDSVIDL